MRYLVAFDSFKDALPAKEVCAAVARGIRLADPKASITTLPLADGGEGTAMVLTQLTNGQTIYCPASDPLGRPITAYYGWQPTTKTAYIDMAAASGLQLLTPEERNPMQTSTYGTGELIMDATRRGAQKIVLGIGGSATNDGGMGMAIALGHQFLADDRSLLSNAGTNLLRVHQWIQPETQLPPIEVLCDVDNPLCGKRGAANVYGPQKGATPKQVQILDQGLSKLAQVVTAKTGQNYADTPGAGAAGGLGFGTMAFLAGTLNSGIQTVLKYANFDQHLQACDLVFTGEGKLDNQTLQGKLIQGVCQGAATHSKTVIALCGALRADNTTLRAIGLQAAFSIQSQPRSLAEALKTTAIDLETTALNVCQVLIHNERSFG